MEPEISGGNQGGRFPKGQSGNPAGKPKGTRHATTLAAEALLDGEARALTRKAIEMAKAGDVTALRLCLDRIVPPRKSRRINFPLPEADTAESVLKCQAAVVAGVSSGELSPDEAAALSSILEAQRRAIETTDHENRIRELERQKERQK